MKIVAACALLLLALLALPAGALAAQPAPAWPSVKDLQQDPGVLTSDAVCMARYYRGRLTRKAWLTPYWNLTRAEKIATDAGTEHCMTRAQRIAMAERFYNAISGRLPQVHCVAVRSEAQTSAQHLAVTSYAKWLRAYEAIFRGCRLTGAVYGEVAETKLHLPMTAAERSCANRIGNATLLMYKSTEPKNTLLTHVGAVYDGCVGAQSEAEMYRYVYRNYKFPSKVPCIARRLAATLTFVEYMTDAKKVDTSTRTAEAACLAGR
jgi:hypothetical protein